VGPGGPGLPCPQGSGEGRTSASRAQFLVVLLGMFGTFASQAEFLPGAYSRSARV